MLDGIGKGIAKWLEIIITIIFGVLALRDIVEIVVALVDGNALGVLEEIYTIIIKLLVSIGSISLMNGFGEIIDRLVSIDKSLKNNKQEEETEKIIEEEPIKVTQQREITEEYIDDANYDPNDVVFEDEVGENQWRCPSCDRVNENYVGTCGCGQPKPLV